MNYTQHIIELCMNTYFLLSDIIVLSYVVICIVFDIVNFNYIYYFHF